MASDERGDDDEGGDNPMIFVGIAALIVLGLYVIIFAASSGVVERYATGFIIERCPVCEVGYLDVEERPYRVLGIPRVRRTVRCDNCRSVLREVGRRRWRYAVDAYANPEMYDELNNTIVTENELIDLAPLDSAGGVSYVDEG